MGLLHVPHPLALNRKYGWRPELPDPHRKFFAPRHRTVGQFLADLRPKMPPIYDQGQIGSCVANATAAAFDYQRAVEGLPFMTPSRLFIYANARRAEGTDLSQDSGCCIGDAVQSVASLGVCPESGWPYVESQFSVLPPAQCYTDALKDLVLEKQAVAVADIPATIASGQAVIGGLTLYESFESDAVASTGIVPMPSRTEQIIGGHGIDLVGVDTAGGFFIGRNSWGTSWGLAGYFKLPIAYAADHGSDFWTLVKVE
jgi:C1A family cysteine protease